MGPRWAVCSGIVPDGRVVSCPKICLVVICRCFFHGVADVSRCVIGFVALSAQPCGFALSWLSLSLVFTSFATLFACPFPLL